jgi:hypothetical protein
MRAVGLGATLAVLVATGTARAEDAEPSVPFTALIGRPPDKPPPAEFWNPFNGIGSAQRSWDLQSNIAYSTQRIFTQTFGGAYAYPWRGSIAVVIRLSAAAEADTNSGLFSIQGLIGSVGLLDRSPSDNYRAEVGLRVIPPWTGPHDKEPAALRLALSATLASDIADDAQWLPFADLGTQIYGMIQNRGTLGDAGGMTFFGGARYGGQVSLLPMVVNSWLGPQTGVIGNAYTELFIGEICHASGNGSVEIGGRMSVSLSSIWPGEDPFPYVASLFLSWSPRTWFALRVFGGTSGVAALKPGAVSSSLPYGARLEFFLP